MDVRLVESSLVATESWSLERSCSREPPWFNRPRLLPNLLRLRRVATPYGEGPLTHSNLAPNMDARGGRPANDRWPCPVRGLAPRLGASERMATDLAELAWKAFR